MSVNELATLGRPLNFSPTLNNPKAAKYQQAYAATTGACGNGLSNNRIFANTSDNQTAAGTQSTLTGNAANQYKIGRYVDMTDYYCRYCRIWCI